MKILHVDDEADIREIAEMALSLDPTFEVASAKSGAAALESISDDAPDVILLDVMMPEMDGPSLLKILRARQETADIPIIFMTAAVQHQTVDNLKSIGAIGVIGKPFDPISLADEIKALLP
ncbi:response regulator [Salipiger bermudensis]|uniref:response regulator n=1 Tax=Salipiger bermudensis TaxID=344736 RepID=UPI001CD20ADB|nr:response regulator [Salipiger bermudensis]MCA0961128.1 response regulator [Salipiger bermudensis]